MKSWHWGIIIAIVVGYVAGIMYPGFGTGIKAKIGV